MRREWRRERKEWEENWEGKENEEGKGRNKKRMEKGKKSIRR